MKKSAPPNLRARRDTRAMAVARASRPPSSVSLQRRTRPHRTHQQRVLPRVVAAATARSFEDIVAERRDALLAEHLADPRAQRFIAIAGPPGGGKSTFAHAVCAAVNARAPAGVELAVVVPMDGFHYPLATLDAWPDPALARARRGAPFTFDAAAFVRCIQDLKRNGYGDVPTFDHALHDPVDGGCRVRREHAVVLVEGNYVLLPEDPWDVLVRERTYDETWFVDTSVDEAMRRVEARHVSVGRSAAEAKARANGNDRMNAELVVDACRDVADVLIPCVDMMM